MDGLGGWGAGGHRSTLEDETHCRYWQHGAGEWAADPRFQKTCASNVIPGGAEARWCRGEVVRGDAVSR